MIPSKQAAWKREWTFPWNVETHKFFIRNSPSYYYSYFHAIFELANNVSVALTNFLKIVFHLYGENDEKKQHFKLQHSTKLKAIGRNVIT